MNQEKFSIRLERELLRINQHTMNLSNEAYPTVFGNKAKNNFIETKQKDCILKLKTPMSKDILTAYHKLEEITNVVYVELYKIGETVWPFTQYQNLHFTSTITLSIHQEFYDEIKKINTNLPNTLEEAYLNIQNQFTQKFAFLEDVFGKCTLKIAKNNLQLCNIMNDYQTRMGITYHEICFLVIFLFSLLEVNRAKELQDVITCVQQVNKLYGFNKNKELKKVEKELASTKSSKEKLEAEMSLEQKNKIAKMYMEEGMNTRYCIQGYPKLVPESVALIKDAISQGIDYNILNETKSIVQLEHNGHKEFVIEGNKTDRDSYIFPIITDDKLIAKTIMAENGIHVPKGILLKSDMEKEVVRELLKPLLHKPLVVKPRNTNYGTGITVFNKVVEKKQLMNAIDYAFQFDTDVLIEEYAKGMEYRFLVIDGKCVSIAHRRPASVVGDGKLTIKELIDKKNKEPWHILLECIVKSDEPVIAYLNKQNYSLDSILPKDKRVFLRSNSNCTTGGESVDYTDVIPDKFKHIAEKVAKVFHAKICGVDILIDDLNQDQYAIVEINDNPGYSINEWPYEGRGERVGMDILKLLGFAQEE